jgi:hypothetical protein
MVAVTYGVARVPKSKAKGVAKAKRAEKAAPTKGWFARFMDALIEARMQQARREIAMHARLAPSLGFDERGNRLVKTGANDMPFGGW